MGKQLSEKRLYNITLYYLSRYDASAGKVRDMLKRRLYKMRLKGEEVPDKADEWIENVIQKMEQAGFINDKRFTENQVRLMSAQGKSNQFMMGKLRQAGIDPDMIDGELEVVEESETDRAKHFARKKKIGPYRPESQQAEFRKKDMAALARAGFSYDVICDVLNSSLDAD